MWQLVLFSCFFLLLLCEGFFFLSFIVIQFNPISFFFLFQIQDGSWHESHFFFHTQDSRQLPIVDIQTFPAPRPTTQRHIEISPVCFFWHQYPCCVTVCMNFNARLQNVHLPKSKHQIVETQPGSSWRQIRWQSFGLWWLKRIRWCWHHLLIVWSAFCEPLWVKWCSWWLCGPLSFPDHRVKPSSSQSQSLNSYLPLAPHQTTLNWGQAWRSELGL